MTMMANMTMIRVKRALEFYARRFMQCVHLLASTFSIRNPYNSSHFILLHRSKRFFAHFYLFSLRHFNNFAIKILPPNNTEMKWNKKCISIQIMSLNVWDIIFQISCAKQRISTMTRSPAGHEMSGKPAIQFKCKHVTEGKLMRPFNEPMELSMELSAELCANIPLLRFFLF